MERNDELDDAVYETVQESAALGDELAKNGEYKEAIQAYSRGWRSLPEPKSRWSVATWLLAIADSAFLGGFMNSARQAIDYAMRCPGAVGNPFLHLRRGQILFEQDEVEASIDELMRAYMGGGEGIFADEPAKYLKLLASRVNL